MNINSISGRLNYLWHKYSVFVEGVTKGNTDINSADIAYWRNKLFTRFITWLVPVSLIALIPGATMGFVKGYPIISIIDIGAACSILIIALNRRIRLISRKFSVVFILYCLAAVLMVYLGFLGPAFIYLLALSVFVTLTFPNKYAYYSIAANFFICLGCALIIYFKLFNSPLIKEFDFGIWVAVSSNLIFLSLVCVVLISYLIKGLEDTVTQEFGLKNQLQQESKERMRNNLLLKESEAHYKSLFFLSPLPMWVLDSDSLRFLQVNEAAIKTYGYSNGAFLKMTIEDIKADEQPVDFLDTFRNINEPESSMIKIEQHRRKNKETFYLEVKFNSIPFRGKLAILGIARDMTEQMNYIKAIEGQNKKLHEIAYIQSHVVRAPLARIIGLVDLVKSHPDTAPDPVILAYLEKSAQEFDEVIKDISID
jgi:PAS domain S-box-containing protein